MSYAEARVTRARQSLLEVHIFGSFPSQSSVNSLLQFLVPVAVRIGSFSLELGADPDTYIPLLLNYFANCIPGTLKQLSLLKTVTRRSNDLTFITAAENPYNPRDIVLNLPQRHLEDIWLSISALQLNGLYLPWASKAYHGLVELRLPFFRSVSITEQQLVAILASSPGLRILEFGLQPAKSLPTHPSIIPVRLDHLERLIASPQRGRLSFLRMLAPGSKPLQLSIMNSPNDAPSEVDWLTDVNLGGFFARSNVARLHVEGLCGHARAIKLLSLVPRDRLLILGVGNFIGESVGQFDSLEADICLDSFYMRSGSAQLDLLGRFIRRCRIQTLMVRQCTLYDVDHTIIPRQRLQDRVLDICHIFKLLPDDALGPFGDCT